MTFRQIDFGSDDAKSDPNLSEYFVRIPEYEKVIAGKAGFVIGRKGTGKTAICQMIFDESQNVSNVFSILLSFKNAPSSDLFASSDRSFRAPNEYISIWKFLIALEATKLALGDESINDQERATLQKFLLENFGNTDVASLDAVSYLKKNEWKVGLDLSEIPVIKAPSGSASRSAIVSDFQRIHYGRAGAFLLEKLKKLYSENEFFLLFDELDEDYRLDDKYFHLVISLFKAAYQVRSEMKEGLKIRPIIVLREDIYSRLDDHDLNKLDDETVRLNWSRLAEEYTEFSLRGLVNERIRAHLGMDSHADLWTTLVDEDNWGGPTDSAWDYMMSRTMDRPRDIIKFLKCCQPCEPKDKLTAKGIDAGMTEYSKWLFNEIGNEIFRELPEYREAIGLLTRIGEGKFTLHDWRSEFGKHSVLNKKYKAEDVLQLLYDYSVIGMLNKGRWLFRYKTPQVTFDLGAAHYIVHYGLHKYLVLRYAHPRDKYEV